jgi:biopolymer transport protein ExbD/biopolymer transport protein TolR
MTARRAIRRKAVMAIGGRAGEVFTDINVTPLTDVFLVLLVIMILIAPLVNSTVLKVDPPAASRNQVQKPDEEKNKIDVYVTSAGVVKVNNVPVSPPDSFTIQQAIHNEQMKAGTDDLPLNLSSDADAMQKYVVSVMDAAAGAGIKRMRVLPLKK